VVALVTVGVLGACSSGGDSGAPTTVPGGPVTTPAPGTNAATTATPTPTTTTPADPCDGLSNTLASADDAPADDALHQQCLRLNQVQVLGTHNSYKLAVPAPIFPLLAQFDPELAAELEYDHPPIPVQLSDESVRQIELDVFLDPDGGLFAKRVGLQVAGAPNDAPPELFEPGPKVLHVQDLDYESSCLTFVACLEQIARWSDEHPGHLPIAVLVELKQEEIPDPLGAGFVQPVPYAAEDLDALDDLIRSVFPDERLIRPDDVRGAADTLEAAVLVGGWPTLADAAGKVLFLMDNGGELRDMYRADRPSLEGRIMFTNATPGDPDAAFVKVNDPLGRVEEIQALVERGYVVRTRSDVPTVQARSGDTTQLQAALSSGAQWVSTDYPAPRGSPFSDYVAALPSGTVGRCNPVNTGPRCVDASVEVLAGS
jgi:hypothetical protein